MKECPQCLKTKLEKEFLKHPNNAISISNPVREICRACYWGTRQGLAKKRSKRGMPHNISRQEGWT